MKKNITRWMLVAVLGIALAAPALVAGPQRDDLRTIKKAVRENPDASPGRELRFLKVLVLDERTGREKVKVTLPLALVDFVLHCAGHTRINMGHSECDVDLGALFDDLKKAGPTSIIEVSDHGETVRIWLE
jgi:hypothetical protein